MKLYAADINVYVITFRMYIVTSFFILFLHFLSGMPLVQAVFLVLQDKPKDPPNLPLLNPGETTCPVEGCGVSKANARLLKVHYQKYHQGHTDHQ